MNKVRKIAKACIGGNRKQSRVLQLGFCALCVFNILLLIFQASILNYRQEENFKKYGAWSGAIYEGNSEIYDFLKNSKDVEKVGKIRVFENVSIYQDGLFYNVGVIDQNAFELGKINLLKGTLPENEKEITLEQYLLKELAPSAQIGDMISIPIQEGKNKAADEYQFILSGVIDSWNENWDTLNYSLPAAFITEGAIKKNTTVVEHIFCLADEKEKYTIHNLDELLKKYTDSTYVYNAKSFSPILSAEDEYFEQGTFLAMLGAIDSIVICFLLSTIVAKMKYSITVIRNIGGDFGTVYEMFMWEAFYLWRTGILLGVGTGAIISGILFLVMRQAFQVNIPIVLNGIYLMISLLILSIIFFISYFVVILSTVGRKLHTSYRVDNSSIAEKKFPAVKSIKPMNTFRLYIRNFQFYPLRNLLRIAVSILSVLVLNVYAIKFWDHYQQYQKIDVTYDYTLSIFDIGQSLSQGQIEQIQEIPGVISVLAEKQICPYDDTISISWDKWTDSEYINVFRKYSYASSIENINKNKSNSYEVESIAGIDAPKLLEWYISCIDEGKLDTDKFLNGEQCILMLSPFSLEEAEMADKKYQVRPLIRADEYNKVSKVYEYENDENSIQPGDIVTIETDGIKKQVEVGGIIRTVTGWPPKSMDGIVGSGEIVVSETFIEKFLGITENDYNSLTIESSANADHAETDWQLMNIVENYMNNSEEGSYYFNNSRESARIVREIEMTGMLQAVFIMVITLLFLGFILFQGTMGKLQNEMKRISILHYLGMTMKKIGYVYWIESIIEGLLSGMIGIIGAGLIQYSIWKKESGYTVFHAVMEYAMNGNSINKHIFNLYVLVFFIYFIIYLLLVFMPLKNMLKKAWKAN